MRRCMRSSIFLLHLSQPHQNLKTSSLLLFPRSFDRLSRNAGTLTLADLSALPELQGNPYVPALYSLLCREAGKKKNGREGLGVVEFGRALETFSLFGDENENDDGSDASASVVFRVLDSDGDGKLDLDELEAALRPVLSKRGGNGGSGGSVGGVPPSLVAVAALRKHDRDGDGRVSLPEFRSLLLSAAGGK